MFLQSAMRSSTRPSFPVCSLFPSRAGPHHRSPQPLPRPLRAPDDTGADPGNAQFCLTAPALPTNPGPNNGNIQYLLNLSLTLHTTCVSFPIPSVSLSRADGSPLYSTNSIACIDTQFSKHYPLSLGAIVFPAAIILDLGNTFNNGRKLTLSVTQDRVS